MIAIGGGDFAIAAAIDIEPLRTGSAMGGAIPRGAVGGVIDEEAAAVEYPNLIIEDADKDGGEKAVGGSRGGEGVGEEERDFVERDILDGGVDARGRVGLHHQHDGVVPRGIDVEGGALVVVVLKDAVDIPVASAPAIGVIDAGAEAEVFGGNLQMVEGHDVGGDVHGGDDGVDGMDKTAVAGGALRRGLTIIDIVGIGGGDGGVDMNCGGVRVGKDVGVGGLGGPEVIAVACGAEEVEALVVVAIGTRIDDRVGDVEDGKMEDDDAVAVGTHARQGVEEDAGVGDYAAVEIVAFALADGIRIVHQGVATRRLSLAGGCCNEEEAADKETFEP